MPQTVGVGFIGAGSATQAIHLPVIARFADSFRVLAVMDTNVALAGMVSERCGARATASAEDLYEDPAVEAVVICSPNQFHAEQVIACCNAGKRVVLCEKPLAVERADAAEIDRLSRATGTRIVVGTMHAFDPAWQRALAAWRETETEASLVRSSIYLPGNDEFISQATDQAMPPGAMRPPPGDLSDPAYQAMRLRNAVLGLAIHDLPLVRALYPRVGQLQTARALLPFGYALTLTNEAQTATLTALMPGTWSTGWTLSAMAADKELRVQFPPSYVLGGSARATVTRGAESRSFAFTQGGYEAMWRHVEELCRGEAPAEPTDAYADIGFALDLIDGINHHLKVG